MSTPARPPKSPPDYSAAPMTEQVPEPAAGANQTVQRQFLTGPRIPEDGNMLGEGLEICSIRPMSGFYGTAAA